MTAHYQRPLPKISEANKPFWEGLRKHQLLAQACPDCGSFRYPPRPMCPNCNSFKAEWRPVSGKGELFSFIVVPAYPFKGAPMGRWPHDDYPINIAIVQLSDAKEIRMISTIVDCPLSDLRVGMPVEVIFDEVTPEVTLAKFRPATQS
jgi:hypothetical protein